MGGNTLIEKKVKKRFPFKQESDFNRTILIGGQSVYVYGNDYYIVRF